MISRQFTLSLIAVSALWSAQAAAEEQTLDPIVVGADFREHKLSETIGSVSVLKENELIEKTTEPLFEVVGKLPNINFTAGASKAKYIQIRGIGERSQFETPMNPSVGLIIDGIDFSYLTLGATMFDLKQIEVLRGPQGTRFGANGMAGVINVESHEPSKETQGHIETTLGNYNTAALGAAVGGTLIKDKLLGRISLFKNKSDGFYSNTTLHRDDTNDIDETTAKAKLRWFVNDDHTIDLTLMHVDVDNGYDAFALDNSRNTQSDKPGKDTQKTNALGMKSTYQINPQFHLVTALSHSSSKLLYSYDEDWTDGNYRAPDGNVYPSYNWFDQYKRKITQSDIDIRMVSDESGKIMNGTTSWTMGLYGKEFKEKMHRNHIKNGVDNLFNYDYKTSNKALYGQLDSALTDKLILTTGLRIEKWKAEYRDSDNLSISTDEVLKGGKLALAYHTDEEYIYYATLSRGYKPGGVNADNTLPASERDYKTETLWNLDLGFKSHYWDHKLVNKFNLFYGKRKDQQVKKYTVATHSFSDYLDNAAKGTYYGLESELDYYPTDALHLYSRVGLLRARFDSYSPELTGRAPAQSPKYQYDIGFDYSFMDNWIFKTDIEGRGSYYFSNTHDQKSKAYSLLNSSISYVNDNWTATVWGRNLTDKEYDVRGFYFGNNPANGWADELYTQKGAPRTFGFTLSYDF
jgi:outer membrane receptor protein involved in Fe transport